MEILFEEFQLHIYQISFTKCAIVVRNIQQSSKLYSTTITCNDNYNYVARHLQMAVFHQLPAQSASFIQFPFHRTFPLGQKHPSTHPLIHSALPTVSHV